MDRKPKETKESLGLGRREKTRPASFSSFSPTIRDEFALCFDLT